MPEIVTEHSSKILVDISQKDPCKKMEVFYNPVMISNRNIAILLLNSLPQSEMCIADPLAGSGVRSLRFLKELKPGKISRLAVNDLKPGFPKLFETHLKLNKISKVKLKDQLRIGNEDAEKFLLSQHQDDFCGYFDYIDLDPFGSPNPFLSAGVEKLKRGGILAVTATDTAALTGTYPRATQRKYWATPLRNYLMHEIGLRILIRRIQLQGVQFEKALFPILAYQKEHYFRVYLQNNKGKGDCDELLKQHQYFLFCQNCLNFKISKFNKENCSCGKEFFFAGPLWTGKLNDSQLLGKMLEQNSFPEEEKFLHWLRDESYSEQIGFYDLHEIARKLKINPPKIELALKKLKGVRTHFSLTGIKSNLNPLQVTSAIKNMEKSK